MKNINIIILCFTVFLINCNYSNKDISEIYNEDFKNFYYKFNSDSSFQVGRIKFPLEGIMINGNFKKNNDYIWKKIKKNLLFR